MSEYERPEDMGEVFETYYDYLQIVARRQGIGVNHLEDAASEIICRFHEKGMLEQYDPERTFEHDGVQRRSKFRSFLTKYAVLTAMGIRTKIKRRLARERSMESPLQEAWTPWIEVLKVHEDDHSTPELGELVRAIRTRVEEEAAPARGYGSWPYHLPELFEAVVEQSVLDGKFDANGWAQETGVSNTSVYQWLNRLRKITAEVLIEQGYERAADDNGWVCV